MDRTVKLQLAAAAIAVATLATMTLHASRAAFTSSAPNEGNQVSAGTVVLDQEIAVGNPGHAMFNDAIVPGDSIERCIEMTYTGTLAAEVRLWGAIDVASTGLENYVDIAIDWGTAAGTIDGSYNCTTYGYTPDATNGTIQAATVFTDGTTGWFDTHLNYTSGDATNAWQPAGGTETRIYRVTVSMDPAETNGQGTAATFDVTWEAQNT